MLYFGIILSVVTGVSLFLLGICTVFEVTSLDHEKNRKLAILSVIISVVLSALFAGGFCIIDYAKHQNTPVKVEKGF